MKIKYKLVMLGLIILLISGCVVTESGINSAEDVHWLIPENEVMDGGPGKDGIAALTNPDFVKISEISILSEKDLVVGIKIGDQIRALPHAILDWHEIVNGQLNSIPYTLSYCPLTGSALGWRPQPDAANKTYGVSGLLYNSNLILYDRETESYWSQMLMQCVHGSLIGEKAGLFRVIETTWKTWKAMYPDALVLSFDTGYFRDYTQYPYGDYKTSDRLIFAARNPDNRLSKKERVFGVIDGNVSKVYPISRFPESMAIINDNINDQPVVVAGNSSRNLAIAFYRRLNDGTVLNFKAVADALPIIMKDDEGTLWDIFGVGRAGPRKGGSLPVVKSFISYWFAWTAFYPNPVIYQQ